MNPNATKNLTKRGAAANPNGRPKKGYSITEMMKDMLKNDPDVKLAIGKKIAEKAKLGDLAAIKMLWQYMDGMPQQDITSKGEKLNSFYDLLAEASKNIDEKVPD